MKSLSTILMIYCFVTVSKTQDIQNLELLSQKNYPEMQSDVWGYVKNGIEYAILGTQKGTAILSLEDPRKPIERKYIPGGQTQWRDIKHWGDYLYVTADNVGDGLLIIDMSKAPQTINYRFWQKEFNIAGQNFQLTGCHNLFIDEKGYAYLSGCQPSQLTGVLILDVHTNPWNPKFVGYTGTPYSHDNFTRGDTCWSAEMFQGKLTAIDVSNKSNPTVLASESTSSWFTHSVWLADDGPYAFTADERQESRIDAYDISDLSNIKRIDSYQNLKTRGTGVVPHNVIYHKGWLVISYYTDGVVILDAHRPDNLILVAQYDTNTEYTNYYHGCWGVYPFLPSGILLASDIENGLFILQPNFVRACYLEGTITNAQTKIPIPQVKVNILSSDQNEEFSNGSGIYKTGQLTAGIFEVEFSAFGYKTKRVKVTLFNSILTTLDVELEPAKEYTLSGQVMDLETGQTLSNTLLQFKSQNLEALELKTDDNGFFSTTLFEDNYTVTSGKWGYQTIEQSKKLEQEEKSWIIWLKKGYQDDFRLDYGWHSTSSATSGDFERGKPKGSYQNVPLIGPKNDLQTDLGEECYITGNGSLLREDEPVSEGTVTLTSPPMNLSNLKDPIMECSTWFNYLQLDVTTDDTLTLSIDDGKDLIPLKSITVANDEWVQHSFPVTSFTNQLNQVRLVVTVTSFPEYNELTEAGLDGFLVREGTLNGSNSNDPFYLQAFPNPSSGQANAVVVMDDFAPGAELMIYNYCGLLMERKSITENRMNIYFGEDYLPGLYLLVLRQGKYAGQYIKWLKM